MIAVDTNVLVRLLVQDDVEQSERAYGLFEREDVFLPETVLIETAWVLQFSYRFDRDSVDHAFRSVLGLPNVAVSDAAKLELALEWHAAGLDFADALHLAACQHTETFFTFDRSFIRKAGGLGRCPVLEP